MDPTPESTEPDDPRLTLEEVLDPNADPVDLLGCAECDVPAGTPCKPDCPANDA